MGVSKNQGVDPYLDPVRHFGAPLGPLSTLDFEVLIEGVRESNNLSSRGLIGGANSLGLDLFTDPISHFGPPGGHIEFCRWRGVPGFEQVAPALQGMYHIQV